MQFLDQCSDPNFAINVEILIEAWWPYLRHVFVYVAWGPHQLVFVDGVALQLAEKCKWWSKKYQTRLNNLLKNANGGARSVRARLQSCHKLPNETEALAPEGLFLLEGECENSPELGSPRTGLRPWGGRVKRSATLG